MHRWWELTKLTALVLAVVFLARMAARLQDVLGLVFLALALALLTAPFRRRLAGAIGPAAATALNALVTFLVVVAIAGLVLRDLQAQADQLAADLTRRIQELEPGSRMARFADVVDAQQGIDRVLGRLPASVVAGEEDAVGIGRQAVDLLFVVILAAFIQSSAASAVDWIVARWPRDERSGVRALLDDIESRGIGYLRRTIVLAGGVAAVVGAAAWALDVPGPALLGVWVGAWSLVPGLGWILAAAPLVGVSIISGSAAGTALLGVGAAALAAATWWRRHRIEPGRLRLGVAPSLLAVAVGVSVGGFAGALVTLVLAAATCAALSTRLPFPNLPSDLAAGDITVAAVERDGGRRASWPGELDGWRSAITLVAAGVAGVLAWALLGKVGHAAVWLVIAGMVAIALDRPVGFFTRHRLARPLAVTVVVLLGLAVIGTAGVLGVRGGQSTTSRLSTELPSIVADLEDAPLVGGWLRDHEAGVWVDEQLRDLPQRVERARGIGDWLPAIGARLLDLVWVVLLAVALLLDGPRLRAALQRRVPARHRRQFVRITDVSRQAVGGYLAGAAFVAGINAAVVFTIAAALGISLAPVLAVWAFIWNFVPQIGGFMGGLPLVLLALTAGPAQALVAGLLFVAYQFAENHVIQPAVIGEAIDVPPWATLLTALAGGAAAGVLGAVVFTPLVGVIRVVLRELGRDDFPGRTAQVPAGPALVDAAETG